MRVCASTSRTTKAIWNILTQAGRRVNVVNWYASHPAEPISGVCVSNLFQEGVPASPNAEWTLIPGAVHPPAWAQRIASARVQPRQITAEMLLPLVPELAKAGATDGRPAMLAKHLAQCTSIQNAALQILEGDEPWDCTMVFYDTIDTVGHNFMQYHPPRMNHVSEFDFGLYQHVMYGLYQLQDMMLGVLLERAGPDTTVVLLSDHGFFSDHRRPVIKDMTTEERAAVEARWHRQLGVLAMSGPGIRPAHQVFGATLLDIAPTALTLLGVPIGQDMQGRVLSDAFVRVIQPESLFSWDLQAGEAGMHPSDLRQDPFVARDAIQQLIDLGYMAAMPQDAKAKAELARRESQCNLATVYIACGQAEMAVPIFKQLAAQYPDQHRFTFGLARALTVAQRPGECAEVMREFLKVDPQALDARVLLANSLATSGDDAGAAAELDQVEANYAGRPEFEAALADVSIALQRWAAAERHYQAALRLDPEAAPLHLGLARALIAQKKFEEAVESSLNAVERVHVYPDAHHTLGVALTWMKDYDHAVKAFETALSMRPGLLESHRYLASIHRHRGDAAGAAKHREIAERLTSQLQSGQFSLEFLRREAPMGPQEWTRQMSLAMDGNDLQQADQAQN
jgi:tetratricopeptide (TPR) repeat protein